MQIWNILVNEHSGSLPFANFTYIRQKNIEEIVIFDTLRPFSEHLVICKVFWHIKCLWFSSYIFFSLRIHIWQSLRQFVDCQKINRLVVYCLRENFTIFHSNIKSWDDITRDNIYVFILLLYCYNTLYNRCAIEIPGRRGFN